MKWNKSFKNIAPTKKQLKKMVAEEVKAEKTLKKQIAINIKLGLASTGIAIVSFLCTIVYEDYAWMVVLLFFAGMTSYHMHREPVLAKRLRGLDSTLLCEDILEVKTLESFSRAFMGWDKLCREKVLLPYVAEVRNQGRNLTELDEKIVGLRMRKYMDKKYESEAQEQLSAFNEKTDSELAEELGLSVK